MPDWKQIVRERLSGLRLDAAREAEIVEELSQHLEEEYQELLQAGASEDAARTAAMQELLAPEALSARMRPLRQACHPEPLAPGAPPRGSLLRDLAQDLRYAFGMLRRQPGFAAGAILTLALGIGANSAIFALVDATLLRPLPLPAADRVVMLHETTDTSRSERVSPLNLLDWRDRNRSFEAMAGYVTNVGGMVLAGKDGTAETIPRQWVTAGFFDALGVVPVAGRTFQWDDDTARRNAAVLTESFWRTRFDADPSIVGRDIRLDGEPYTVLGVVPDTAQILGKTSIWGLASIQGAPPRMRAAHPFRAIGLLRPDTTLAMANADLSGISDQLAREYPDTNEGRGVTAERLDRFVIGADLRQTSMLFIGVVLFVLLICCANVANLLLARAAARGRELAIRTAIGADRARLIRQLLTESIVLSLIGGGLGLLLGAGILRVAPALIPEGLLPPAVALTFDLRVVAFCAGAALIVGVLFGLAPAWHATGGPAAPALAADSRTTIGGGGGLRNLLVAGEVATAVLLLVGAGLLLRTLLAVQNIDRGYRADSILTMIVDPLGSRYPTPEKLMQFYEAVEQEVRAVPRVRSVAWASTLPLGTSYAGRAPVAIVGDPPPDDSDAPSADLQVVSNTYFDTLDLPIVAGRAFDSRDTRGGVTVCIVNEAFVRTHIGARAPVGMRVSLKPDPNAPAEVCEIVGVARQVKGRPDETEEFQQVYVPLAQVGLDDMFMVVRPESGRAGVLAPSVRAAIGRVDKEQLVSVRSVLTLEDVAWEATARQRFRAVLVTAFAALALVLAMVGLFGILAYSVQRRVRDLGVRRALGATTGDVVRSILLGAGRVLGAGLAAGVVLAVVFARLLDSMLFGVAPLDPVTFVLVVVLLAVTALVAVAGPAWRAARVDPVVALRAE